MNVSAQRHKVHFVSGGTECAAWHYPGSNGGCVVMAAGVGVTKEPGTDRFAKRFNEAGFTVLAFDFLNADHPLPQALTIINTAVTRVQHTG